MFMSPRMKTRGKSFPIFLEDALKRLQVTEIKSFSTSTANDRTIQKQSASLSERHYSRARRHSSPGRATRKRDKGRCSKQASKAVVSQHKGKAAPDDSQIQIPTSSGGTGPTGPHHTSATHGMGSSKTVPGFLRVSTFPVDSSAPAARPLKPVRVEFPRSLQIRAATLQRKYELSGAFLEHVQEDFDEVMIDLVHECNKPPLFLPDIDLTFAAATQPKSSTDSQDSSEIVSPPSPP